MSDFAKASLRVFRAANPSPSADEVYLDLLMGPWEFSAQHGQLGTKVAVAGNDIILAIPENIANSVQHLVALQSLEAVGGATITVTWNDGGGSNTQDIPPGGLLVLPKAGRTMSVQSLTSARMRVCVLSPAS